MSLIMPEIKRFIERQPVKELEKMLSETIDELYAHGLLCYDGENQTFYWDCSGERLDEEKRPNERGNRWIEQSSYPI